MIFMYANVDIRKRRKVELETGVKRSTKIWLRANCITGRLIAIGEDFIRVRGEKQGRGREERWQGKTTRKIRPVPLIAGIWLRVLGPLQDVACGANRRMQ